jgi:integrase
MDNYSRENLNHCEGDTGYASEAGNHSLVSEWNYDPGTTPPGQAGIFSESLDDILDLEKIIEVHDRQLQRRLRPKTLRLYRIVVRRLARVTDFEDLSRQQLRGGKGKKLLLEFLDTVPIKSKAFMLSALKSYWTIGVRCPWPIDPRQDLRPLPKIGRRHTPLDSDVKQLAERYALEADPYLRLIWELIAQYGLRPSQVVRLLWVDIKRDSEGRPISIQADGAERQFKSVAPITAAIFPSVADALLAWEKVSPYHAESDPILCWRDAHGRMKHEPLNERLLYYHWLRQKRHWNLGSNPVCPALMRHWVNTIARKCGLSKPSTAALCGHDVGIDPTYCGWYDNPVGSELLAEQLKALPFGPLGWLNAQSTRILDQLPSDAAALVGRYLKNEIPRSELADELDRLRVLYTQDRARKGFKSPEIGDIIPTGNHGSLIPDSPACPEIPETLSITFSNETNGLELVPSSAPGPFQFALDYSQAMAIESEMEMNTNGTGTTC